MNENQPLRKVSVDLDELCAALDDASFEHRYFLDTETGEVIFISDMSDEDEIQEQLDAIDEAEPGAILKSRARTRTKAIAIWRTSSSACRMNDAVLYSRGPEASATFTRTQRLRRQ